MKEYVVQIKMDDSEFQTGLFNAFDAEDAKRQALMIYAGTVEKVFERVE